MPSPRSLLFGLYVVVCAAALTWPVYDLLGNRIEPFVVGWVLATFGVLALYHASRPRR